MDWRSQWCSPFLLYSPDANRNSPKRRDPVSRWRPMKEGWCGSAMEPGTDHPFFIVSPAERPSFRGRSGDWRTSRTGRRTRHFGSAAKGDCGIWSMAVFTELSFLPDDG